MSPLDLLLMETWQVADLGLLKQLSSLNKLPWVWVFWKKKTIVLVAEARATIEAIV